MHHYKALSFKFSLLICSPFMYSFSLQNRNFPFNSSQDLNSRKHMEKYKHTGLEELVVTCIYSSRPRPKCRKHRTYTIPGTLVCSPSTKRFQHMLNSFLNQVLNSGDSSQFQFFTSKPMKSHLKTYSVKVSVKSQLWMCALI